MVINVFVLIYILQIAFFSLKFVKTVFVSSSYDLGSAILSHVTTELSIILAKYLPFLQLHVEGFQM